MPAGYPRAWGLALVVAGLLLTGCGGDDSPASRGDPAPGASESPEAADPAAPADPGDPGDPGDTEVPRLCDLLTTAEVAAAVGSAMQDGESVREGTCSWLPEDAATGVGVSVFHVGYAGPGSAEAACASGVSGLPDPTALPGIGTEAHWFVDEAEAGSAGGLWICLEQSTLNVAVSGPRSGADLQQVAVAVADTLVPRI